jgi:adenylate cyclase
MTWGFGFSYLTVVEGASKRRVKKMLSQYVSETMLNEVLIAPEDVLHAGVGRKEKLTVLFSDIRSFTVISESLPAEQVVTLLNTYFKEMTDTIFKHQGTLDKFIGDAIMAFWGAPIRVDNDAIKAVTTAIEMISRLDLVNEKLALEELPTIEIGVGVNTGEVILGNIGSDRKLDYTVIGDPVNTASRLEGITKQYGVPIVISESTKLELSDEFVCILLDHVRVKGKRTISPIYYPVLRSSEELSELESLAQHAFDLYRQQQWQQALTVYRKLPWSQFVAVYEQRIAHFLQNPPGKDWDGIYTFQTK